MSRLVFIDIETTGLISGYHEIIEVAVIGDGFTYHKKVKPLRLELADSRALAINGYTSREWRTAEEPNVIAEQLATILKGCTIVGHNPNFDMEFIEELLEKYGAKTHYDYRFIDTITLAYEHLSPCGLESFSLDSCRRFFGWDTAFSHTALQDAQDCKRLFYTLLRANRIKRWSWLLRPKITAFLTLRKHKKAKSR